MIILITAATTTRLDSLGVLFEYLVLVLTHRAMTTTRNLFAMRSLGRTAQTPIQEKSIN